MALGVVFTGPEFTEAQYRQVLHQVSPDNQPAAGLLYHAAGPTENGFCVVEVWESQATLDRFVAERLGAALQDAGLSLQPISFEVVNTIMA